MHFLFVKDALTCIPVLHVTFLLAVKKYRKFYNFISTKSHCNVKGIGYVYTNENPSNEILYRGVVGIAGNEREKRRTMPLKSRVKF